MSKRILVVEDQEDLRAILRDFLSASGYTVIEAIDGAEGVAKAAATGGAPANVLVEGTRVKGKVTGVERYGIFVQIAGTQGVRGVGVTSPCRTSQSGARLRSLRRW